MFTLTQINEIHERFGSEMTLSDYLTALKEIGVEKYDTFISDGHAEYFGKDDQKLVTPPLHEPYSISDKSHKKGLMEHLSLHSQGQTDYFEMTQGLAASGIEKWSFDTNKMTISYLDKKGKGILVEMVG